MCVTLGLMLAACSPVSTAARPPATITLPAPVTPPDTAPTAPAPEATLEQETSVPTVLPAGPLAPELTNEIWLNSEPLRRADLSGKLVLIDFWTFG
jgi:hypothetical protein